MAIELTFPRNGMQQGFPKLLEQISSGKLYLYKIGKTEARLEWLKEVGRGSVRFAYPCSGLQIAVEDQQLKEDLVLKCQHVHTDPLKFYFLISGEVSGIVGQPASPFVLQAGQNCLTACGGDRA
ncbi:MAG: hypothetical protein AB4290_02160, partial [Spirulina sp.]